MYNQDNSNHSEFTDSEKLNQDKASSVQLKDEEGSHPKPSSQNIKVQKESREEEIKGRLKLLTLREESRKEEIKRRLELSTLREIRLKLFILPTLLFSVAIALIWLASFATGLAGGQLFFQVIFFICLISIGLGAWLFGNINELNEEDLLFIQENERLSKPFRQSLGTKKIDVSPRFWCALSREIRAIKKIEKQRKRDIIEHIGKH